MKPSPRAPELGLKLCHRGEAMCQGVPFAAVLLQFVHVVACLHRLLPIFVVSDVSDYCPLSELFRLLGVGGATVTRTSPDMVMDCAVIEVSCDVASAG